MALCGGIVLEEALDLSSDRILNEWMNDCYITKILIIRISTEMKVKMNSVLFRSDGISYVQVRRSVFNQLFTTLGITYRGLPSLDRGGWLYSVGWAPDTQRRKNFRLLQGTNDDSSNVQPVTLSTTPTQLSQFYKVCGFHSGEKSGCDNFLVGG